jgi:outer membrane beta-barrel protein
MQFILRSALFGLLLASIGAPTTAAFAADGDGAAESALSEFRAEREERAAVENRFFLKKERFEISPVFGYVPNNPFARRYVGGAVIGYHIDEILAASVSIGYAPDGGEGDLKPLVPVLLDRARNAQTGAGSSDAFQQPLDKIVLSFSAGVSWAPIYGKINLVGETVLNFDFYTFLGVGMVSKQNFVATYDENADVDAGEDFVRLQAEANEVRLAPAVGIGQNYFLNQTMALKLDACAFFWVDDVPNYDASAATENKRLYNNFTASVGLALFFPKMKPRLYDF